MEKPWDKKETLGGPIVGEKLGGPVDPKTSGDPVLEPRGDERPPAQGLFKAVDVSYDKVTEAMAGRLESDIPLDDEYWAIKNLEVLKWNKAKDRITGETSAPPPPDEALPKIVMSEEERLKQEKEAEIKLGETRKEERNGPKT